MKRKRFVPAYKKRRLRKARCHFDATIFIDLYRSLLGVPERLVRG